MVAKADRHTPRADSGCHSTVLYGAHQGEHRQDLPGLQAADVRGLLLQLHHPYFPLTARGPGQGGIGDKLCASDIKGKGVDGEEGEEEEGRGGGGGGKRDRTRMR